jgi:hypothetical protein
MVRIILLIMMTDIFIGGDENTKVGVAGDSAGGTLAASVCHTIKNLDFQVDVLYSIKVLAFSLNRSWFMVHLMLVVKQNHRKNLSNQNMF